MEVQSGQDDADGRVESVARRDGGVVCRGYGTIVGRVGAADVRDGFGIEFGFDPAFANDKDLVLGRGEGEDTRNVNCGAVCGAKDFVLAEMSGNGPRVDGEVYRGQVAKIQ